MPASWNRRMQRQLGVFLCDTLQYEKYGVSDLDGFLDQKEPAGTEPGAILTKVLIPHKAGAEIFERLEIMRVTATVLFESHEAAAWDVINAFNYDRKTGRAWDI